MIVSVPLARPVLVGANVTLMVQLAPAPVVAREHVPGEAANGAAAATAIATEALPELVTVTVWAALVVPIVCLPKFRLVGDTLTDAEPPPELLTPLPVRLRIWGLFGALSEMLTVPVRVPVAVGVKMTVIEQLLPAASELPQSPELGSNAKSPVMVKAALNVNEEVPPFLTVAVPTALGVPTVVLGNVSGLGVMVTLDEVDEAPVPVRLAVCVPALSATESAATRVPVAVGLNVTLIVHAAAAAKEAPQVWV